MTNLRGFPLSMKEDPKRTAMSQNIQWIDTGIPNRVKRSMVFGVEPNLDEFVDQVFQHFLASAGQGRLAICECVGFELFESDIAIFNSGTNVGIPSAVAFFHKVLPTAVF